MQILLFEGDYSASEQEDLFLGRKGLFLGEGYILVGKL